MNTFSYFLALITSVGVMTLFSATMGFILKCEFREYILLSKVMAGHSLKQKESFNYILLGWLVHFAIGGFFLVLYACLWHYTILIQNVLGSMLYGIVIGILGILGWTLLFNIAPHTPKINYKAYYMQLIVAHVFFSLGNLLVFSLFN
ncbi:hypothetical protein FNB79_10655 [Formosa sediminum]|uniref:DUF2938 domain-containing protein n=1 Tax=Formosa sediminum TaxID=2594004 RepID=A0A516GS99_9FLAO|nr:hypothetical protein [Formosa sediminum]QDO94401.1 hypothetical protein FNB79_10655 [Formosa sediminum]